jgi:alkylation response protein AidB-like acyl-CoA dehydrogenase
VTVGAARADVATAKGLAPRIAEVADEIERERRLPAGLVAALVEAGIFSMLTPASLGGAEVDLPRYLPVIEELAKADGSVAWCVGQASGLWSYAAYLEPDAARRLFGNTPVILSNGPGIGNKPGTAVPTQGGYRISGRWMFSSGIRHANWLLGICQLQDSQGAAGLDADGDPALRLMLFPKEQAESIDTWHVSGLRGTGSFDFAVQDLFVPNEQVIWATPARRHERGALYQFSSSGIFGPTFGSVALGIADACLGTFLEFASGKTPRGVSRTVRDSQVVQATIARASARLEAARLLLRHKVSDAWDAAVAGELDMARRVGVRLAATHATHEACAVVDVAYEAAGSTAIFADKPFERRFRDVHAVSQQLQGRAAHFETVGRYLLGLDPDSTFL